jgi:hypothetical protein
VDVSFQTAVVEKFPFEERIEEDEAIAPGIVYVVQYGLPGYTLKRVRTIRWPDGAEKIEKGTDVYPPTLHIVRVNPATGYTGLTDAERGLVEAAPADEGALTGADLEDRPADFASPSPPSKPAAVPPSEGPTSAPAAPDGKPAWTIVNGPLAHPPKPGKLP